MTLATDFREIEAIVILIILVGAFAWVIVSMFRPGSPERLKQSAEKAITEERYEDALKLLRKAESRNPRLKEDPNHQLRLAQLLHATGDFPAATPKFLHVLSVMETDHPYYFTLADSFCTAALTYHASKVFPEAEKIIRQAIEVQPDSATLKGTLGSLLAEMGRDDEAFTLLQSINASADSAVDIGISAAYLSVLAARRGDVERSATYRQQALEVLPEDLLVKRLLNPPAPTT